MTEEEKKAIEIQDSINILKDTSLDINTIDTIDLITYNLAVENILNLIEKLQKENIKIKQEQAKRSWIHVKENGEVEPLLYISKDKIRKKIEELENGEQCYYEFSTRDLNGYVELMNEKILDDVEKEYLSNVIKPFRERVISIEKIELSFDSCTERNICIKMDDESFILPILRNSNYYKGMKCNFDYPIEELGL